jgi:hypothetical protein
MKTFKILLLLLCTLPAFAQADDAVNKRDPQAQQKIKAAHAAYITERLELTPEEAEKFWPVYREYTQKRQGLRQQFREARKSGQDEKALLDLDLKIKQQELDLEKDYSERFQKIITPQKLRKLRQAEGDFKRLILRQIQQRQQMEKRHQMHDRSNQRLRQRNN